MSFKETSATTKKQPSRSDLAKALWGNRRKRRTIKVLVAERDEACGRADRAYKALHRQEA